MTERLYYDDPHLQAFDARVVSAERRAAAFAVVLDRTAFYPTGGGQLHDTGTLGGACVLEVAELDGQVIHRTDRIPNGTVVRGEVDWPRRVDLTQQHTGQHILSQTFHRLFGAATVSVHMTESNCTLDLDKHLNPDQHDRAEALANEIVRNNLPVRAAFVAPGALAGLPLRKPPEGRHDKIRIVEVEGFDWSPCGGTHVQSTGALGLIKVVRAERRGSEQRIEFACGTRALRDYGWKNRAVLAMAAQMGIQPAELPRTVQRLAEENRESRRLVNALRSQALDVEADRLWTAATLAGQERWIERVFQGRAADEVRTLAIRLKNRPRTVVLFAVEGERPLLVFARSADLLFNASDVLRHASATFGGRGGGQPELAQGGVTSGSDLNAVLAIARQAIHDWPGEGA